MNNDCWEYLDDVASGDRTTADKEKYLEVLLKRLSDEEVSECTIFVDRALDALHTPRIFHAFLLTAAEPNAPWIEDSFLEFRQWLVLQGRAVYERVVREPDDLAEIDEIGASEILLALLLEECDRRELDVDLAEGEAMSDIPRSELEMEDFLGQAVQRYPKLVAKLNRRSATP